MEIKLVPFEGNLELIINNQAVIITPFLTGEEGNIKIGIKAPMGLSVDREEIHKQKLAKRKRAMKPLTDKL